MEEEARRDGGSAAAQTVALNGQPSRYRRHQPAGGRDYDGADGVCGDGGEGNGRERKNGTLARDRTLAQNLLVVALEPRKPVWRVAQVRGPCLMLHPDAARALSLAALPPKHPRLELPACTVRAMREEYVGSLKRYRR